MVTLRIAISCTTPTRQPTKSVHIEGLVQACGISIALTMEIMLHFHSLALSRRYVIDHHCLHTTICKNRFGNSHPDSHDSNSSGPVLALQDSERERSSGWLLWSSLETLKANLNVPSDDQGRHHDDIFLYFFLCMFTGHATLSQAYDYQYTVGFSIPRSIRTQYCMQPGTYKTQELPCGIRVAGNP